MTSTRNDRICMQIASTHTYDVTVVVDIYEYVKWFQPTMFSFCFKYVLYCQSWNLNLMICFFPVDNNDFEWFYDDILIKIDNWQMGINNKKNQIL